MTTARSIITTALRRIGAIATGEVPTTDEAQDALLALNEMLETWSLENLMVLSETITTKVLTASTASYTVGSGGDIDIGWAEEITQAQLRVTTGSQDLDLPLTILNEQEWGAVRLKSEESTYPHSLFLHTTYPLATLYLWPVPTEANTLVLWTRGTVASFATMDTDVSLAPGYARAIRRNLEIELADDYGRVVTPEMREIAYEAKAQVKRSNTKPVYATIDVPAGDIHGSYDWRGDGA